MKCSHVIPEETNGYEVALPSHHMKEARVRLKMNDKFEETINRQSSIVNPQWSIVNGQSSMVNRPSLQRYLRLNTLIMNQFK